MNLLFKNYVIIGFVLFSLTQGILLSQPVNDDCSNPIDLGILPYCSSNIFSNVNAASNDIGNNNTGTCFDNHQTLYDVWFVFKPNQSIEEYTISIKGVGDDKLTNIQAVIYRGTCLYDGMVQRNCAEAKSGESNLIFDIEGLTPGEKYYLRVSNFGNVTDEGDFTICIEEKYDYNIKHDNFSNHCSGTLYDSGGEFGKYSKNEDYSFTICPEGDVKSISFDFDYYNIPLINEIFEYDTIHNPDYKYGDYLNIFNGPDTSYSKFLKISGNSDDFFLYEYMFGSGVDYQNCINSPCITIAFHSDDTLEAEGFVMNWNCNTEYCNIKDSMALNIKNNVPQDELLSHLLKQAITVENVKINCDDRAMGVFQNAGDDLGIKKGLILTSGLAANAKGPNNKNVSFAFNTSGDSDLDSLSALLSDSTWVKSFDACVIELDVVPYGENISYKYLFGSEEYPEFSTSEFNDIFALLISGKDIQGLPAISNKKNMAIIPNTDDFVEIRSINPYKNWQYYHSNYLGKELQYDGLVYDSLGINHYMVANQTVTPCDTYHLKFAIADRLDSIYDSGVFIGDLTDGRPEIIVKYSENIDYLIDNCDINKAIVVIKLPFIPEEEKIFSITLGGTAKKNVDYTTDIPNLIKFQKGENTKVFEINIIMDDLPEGQEEIEINLYREFICGSKKLDAEIIPIRDFLDVEIVPDLDTIFGCRRDTVELSAMGDGQMRWNPVDFIDKPDSTTIKYFGHDSTWVVVKAQLVDSLNDNCIGFDSVFIKNTEIEFEIDEDSIKKVCPGTEFDVSISTNTDNYSLVWSPAAKIKSENRKTTATFKADTSDFMVYSELIADGCYSIDSVWIDVSDVRDVELMTDPETGYFIGDTIIVRSNVYPSLFEGDNIQWNVDVPYFEESDNQINIVLEKNKSLVMYILTDENGCSFVDTLIISADTRKLLFPNAIFPDDPENSIFKFYKWYNGLEIITFEIFDRWGEKVFSCQNKDCAEKGWDATYLGKQVSPGIYIYRCVVKTPNGKSEEYKGSLSVLR